MSSSPSIVHAVSKSAKVKDTREIKKERIHGFLEQHGLDSVLLTLQSNVSWYTDGGRCFVNLATEDSIAHILITSSEEHLFTNSIEIARLAKEEFPWTIQCEHVNLWWDDSGRSSAIARLCGKRTASDKGELRREIARLRYSLLPTEVDRYKTLGQDVAASFWESAQLVRAGMTEFDLASELSHRLLCNGIYPLVILAAFDGRIASYRHPLPTMNKLRNIAMMSVCGRRSGLIVSATRFMCLSKPSADLQTRYAAVTRLDAWLMRNSAPGKRIADLFRGLQEEYARVGFPDEWKLHHQGGATGYETRDYKANDSSEEIIQTSQAFAWNPTITGAKSEDTILVDGTGTEILSADPRWPVISMDVDGQIIKRPDILVIERNGK